MENLALQRRMRRSRREAADLKGRLFFRFRREAINLVIKRAFVRYHI